MRPVTQPARTLKGRAFIALGYVAMALQTYNLYLFIGMIGK